jgi:hypothetical protein
MKTALVVLLVAGLGLAQTTVNASSVTLDANAQGALARWMMSQTTPGVSPTLATAVDATATTFVLSSGTGLGPTSTLVLNGVEIVQCTAKPGGATFTCTRGQIGTAAVSHAVGVSVRELIYKTPNQAGTELMRGQLRAIMRADPVITAAIAAAQAAAEATITSGVQ